MRRRTKKPGGRSPFRTRLRLEWLESRNAPATLVDPMTVTYQDVDGDFATVKISQPLFDAGTINNVFLFDTGSVNGDNSTPQQLQRIDLTALGSSAGGSSLAVTAQQNSTGDGRVNVGFVHAANIDLGTVRVAGDLGRIDAGDGTTTTTGLDTLQVRSLGQFGTSTQAPGGDLSSVIQGLLNNLNVETDIVGASVSVVGGANGKIGTVQVGGSLIGGSAANSGQITSSGGLGPLTIGGDLRGGNGNDSGRVRTFGGLGDVTVGGSVVGGAGPGSATIASDGGMGQVRITGDLQGGSGTYTARIISKYGSITGLQVGGSLIGTGTFSGFVSGAGSIGAVDIGGDLVGGTGSFAGHITSGGSIASVTVGGSLIGGAGFGSGEILSNNMGEIMVKKDIQGGSGTDSGRIQSYGELTSIKLDRSLLGGSGNGSGTIVSLGNMGSLMIKNDVQGGSVSGTDSLDTSGYIQGQRINSIFIGGSIISGTNTGTGSLTKSGSIRVQDDIGSIKVKGSLLGNSTNPVVISARGQPVPTATTDLAIQSLSVKGQVTDANILAGYDVDGNPTNADAQIGDISVDGDWIASNVAAGVTAGLDGFFGTADDTKIAGGSAGILSEIGSIVIKGQVIGTPSSMSATDHFGFVAELIAKVRIGGNNIALHAGPDNDNLLVGTTGDVSVLEL